MTCRGRFFFKFLFLISIDIIGIKSDIFYWPSYI